MTNKDRSEPGPTLPLIAWSGSSQLGATLERGDYRLLELLADGGPRKAAKATPRLVVLGESKRRTAPLADVVRSVRSRWPLVDAIVHSPEATPALVRDLLQAGARDVVLESGKAALLGTIEATLEGQRLLPMVERLSERRVRSSRFEGMLSRSHAMWDVFETCARVAPTDANVLICGETGTGKELLARALHRQSKRNGRFVAVNCGSLPEHLIESELFGHEKGAFTGAVGANKGIFRHAEGGTVLLDEIGDMPAPAQQSLLRVLEERTVRPVGSSQEIDVDVRIVAATHVGLEESVADGQFREDLFYRLDVIRLEIPPLRERPEDIVYLFGHFAKSLAKHYGVDQPKVSDAFLARLAAYPWPGNIRELENFAERVVLRTKRGTLSAEDFTRLVRPTEEPLGSGTSTDRASEARAAPAQEPNAREIDSLRSLAETLDPVIEDVEKRYLAAVLERTGGRIQEAARLAGISRRTLQRKLGAHGIDKSRFRRP